ncbi:MAG: flagellar motor protein MotA [Candidatus Syntrophoarchaeum caldarius]|uniref:Flagellar motor protein MotA n=1 Tax=Candidatus Syntropharchaeum caldarium TaxID=1838285 RepID=A0A1F2PCY7_9EURY|nr:MAG: flagellar motor protein MotA [Candidatus Syntrophoarchaeum caldarius]
MIDIFATLQSSIYYISTYLLYPVIIALLICVGFILVDTGSFLYEIYRRKRLHFEFEDEVISGRFVALFMKELEHMDHEDRYFDLKLQKLLNDMEYLISKRLELTKLISRIGPMFGLMGTLIPMGPALIGLTHGDIETLADNLIIAFGTTVVGLLVGAVSYSIAMVRTRWYDQEMDDMEFVCEIVTGGSQDEIHEEEKR